MQTIKRHYDALKARYDTGAQPLDAVRDLSVVCLKKLDDEAIRNELAGGVHSTMMLGDQHSRPLRWELFEPEHSQFCTDWNQLVAAIDPPNRRIKLDVTTTNRALYTALMSFCACYDLWKRSSRKTPGTFFEVIAGSLLSKLLPAYSRAKHVIIPNETENVSTDLVFTKAGTHGLVLPVKITTRERIVQPFAHQRILNSVFGENAYKSVLISCSELQLDGTTGVKEVCVPGTIRLFQKHLAKLSGLYYLDPPNRYLKADVQKHIPVRSLGELLTTDLAGLTT